METNFVKQMLKQVRQANNLLDSRQQVIPEPVTEPLELKPVKIELDTLKLDTLKISDIDKVAKSLEKVAKSNEAMVRIATANSKKEKKGNSAALKEISTQLANQKAVDMKPIADALNKINENNPEPVAYRHVVTKRDHNSFIQEIISTPIRVTDGR